MRLDRLFHRYDFCSRRSELDVPDEIWKSVSRSAEVIAQNHGISWVFYGLKKTYGLFVEHEVLNYGKPLTSPDASVTFAKATLDAIQLKEQRSRRTQSTDVEDTEQLRARVWTSEEMGTTRVAMREPGKHSAPSGQLFAARPAEIADVIA